MKVLPYYRVSIDVMRVCFCQAFVSEANILESQKIPSASFRKNTVQSSSILNRIKFITMFPSRQYKRRRSQYFDTFSQLSLCNCKADIYEAGGLFVAWVLYCIPRSPA